MSQLEWSTLRRRVAGGIEAQLWQFVLPSPLEIVIDEDRKHAILSLTLPPQPARRGARYEELGSTYHDVGGIMLTPASARCQYFSDVGRHLAVACLFDKALFERVTGLSDAWSAHQLLATLDIRGRAGELLDPILRRMARELETPGFAAETMLEGLGLTALAELSRHLNTQGPADLSARGKLSAAQLRQIERHVVETTARAPTITDLARLCDMGPRRFTTLFRATTGQTVRTWVEGQRMGKARRLLVETKLPLKMIAFELGFASQGVFSMAFRRYAGLTPSQYRDDCSLGH